MRTRSLPGVLPCALLALAACSSEPEPPPSSCPGLQAPGLISTEFEVDCTGLNVWPYGGGTTFAESRLAIYGPDGSTSLEVSAARCSMVLFEPLATPVTRLGLNAENLGQTGAAGIVLYHQGSIWTTTDGCMTLDTYETEPRKGVGRYEVYLAEKNEANQLTGRFGRARGAIDWCAYGLRPDCPIKIDASFTRKVTYRSPLVVLEQTQGEDLLSDCRVLIDSSGGVQVDLELATKGGIPVTQLEPVCNLGQVRAPRPNHFTFQATKTTGPGTYGPETQGVYSGYKLPDFQWQIPRLWDAHNTSEYCSVLRGKEMHVELSGDGACTWTIEENPGKFTLSCDDAVALAEGALGGSRHGEFSLQADCDVRYR